MQLLISILTAVISFVLGVFVLQKNWKSATNVYFSLLIFFLSLYPIFNFLSLNAGSSADALLWSKFILFSAIPAGPLFLFFVSSFPGKKFFHHPRVQAALLGWLLVNIVLAYTGLIFQKVEVLNGNLTLVPGPGVVSFALLQMFGILGGLVVLVRKYSRARGKERLQLQYITLGICISFLLMLISTVILPLVFGVTFLFVFSPLFLLIGGISIAYSIIKHQLLDIRPALARGVSFTLLILLVAVLHSSFVFFFSQTLLQVEIHRELVGLYTVLSIVVAFSFQPLLKIMQKLTDRIFYKDSYDSNKLLYEASVIMASTLHLEDIVHLILRKILYEMKIQDGSFVLTEEGKIYQVATEGKEVEEVVYDEQKLQHLLSEKEVFDINTVSDHQVKQLMKKFGVEVVVTLFQEGKHLGWLFLGSKLSGEMFSSKDYRVLEILAPEIAVAIQNAKSYEEIRRFNITLADEVDMATKNLIIANEKLQQLDQLKDEFISVASHELRTPMTAIKSYLWMALQGKGGDLTEKQKYYLERAYSSTDRLIKLVNEMLNISRIESGRVALHVQKVELFGLLEEVIAEVKPRADELDLSIRLKHTIGGKEGDGRRKVEVLVDVDKFKEVMINLIGNSLKFTPKKGKISIAVMQETAKEVTIAVADTGVGITKDNLPSLFQKFGLIPGSYRTNQDASQGTGLGLYISRSIIELHGGKIWAESEGKDKGATFSFTIPVYAESKEKAFDKKFKETTDAGIIRNSL